MYDDTIIEPFGPDSVLRPIGGPLCEEFERLNTCEFALFLIALNRLSQRLGDDAGEMAS